MKKRILIVISILIIILITMVVLVSINLNKENIVKKEITLDEYNIVINLDKNKKIDNSGSYFTTVFKKKRYDEDKKDEVIEKFYVSYVEIKNKEKLSNYIFLKSIKINDKKFYYIEKGNTWNIALYYEVSKDKYLVINVRGDSVVYSDGSECKCFADISDNVLKSKELKEVLNFKIKK